LPFSLALNLHKPFCIPLYLCSVVILSKHFCRRTVCEMSSRCLSWNGYWTSPRLQQILCHQNSRRQW